jgi:hypothetical protein
MKRRNFITSLLALVPAFLLPKVAKAEPVTNMSDARYLDWMAEHFENNSKMAQEINWFDHGILRAEVIGQISMPNPMLQRIPNISGYGWSKYLPPLRVRYLAKRGDLSEDGIQFGLQKETIAYPLTANFHRAVISNEGSIYLVCIRPCIQQSPSTVAVFAVDNLMYYGDSAFLMPDSKESYSITGKFESANQIALAFHKLQKR